MQLRFMMPFRLAEVTFLLCLQLNGKILVAMTSEKHKRLTFVKRMKPERSEKKIPVKITDVSVTTA